MESSLVEAATTAEVHIGVVYRGGPRAPGWPHVPLERSRTRAAARGHPARPAPQGRQPPLANALSPRSAAPAVPGPLDPGVSGIPEGYHRLLAPRLIEPWTQDVVEAVPLPEGAAVLDLACGTGLVARALPGAVRVVGVDGWDEMTRLARTLAPGVAWTTGDFHRLPFRDASFDAVLCQQGLQFADDLGAVLSECRRVLRPDGHATFATWADLASSPGFARLRDEVARHWGEEAAPGVAMPFSLDDPAALRRALREAGFAEVRVERRARTLVFPGVPGFLRAYVAGSYLLDLLPGRSVGEQQALLDGLEAALAPWLDDDGALRFPLHAHLSLARAP